MFGVATKQLLDEEGFEDVKKVSIFLAALLLLLPLLSLTAQAAPKKDELVSRAAVLIDADTGEVLYSKNRNKKMYPASITKILTGLLVVESCSRKDIATVSAGAVKLPRGYAHIALADGDTLSIDDAMYALMLASANDAANVLAEHTAGSRKKFVQQMNERAEEIGAGNSHFANPSGVPSKKHYTTAYDMALITREAIGNKTFRKYFGYESAYMLPAFNSKVAETEIQNAHYMMQADKSEYNPYVIGGKLGYTAQAGYTMCTVAQQEDRTLICVVMGSTRSGKYQDTELLLQYGFQLD